MKNQNKKQNQNNIQSKNQNKSKNNHKIKTDNRCNNGYYNEGNKKDNHIDTSSIQQKIQRNPVKPIRFEIAPAITLDDLYKVGFRNRKDGYYSYKLNLYDDKISSTVLVDTQDMHIIASVTDCDGSSYTPFYDLDSQLYNDVSKTVMRRYNSWALKMIRMGVLVEIRDNNEREYRNNNNNNRQTRKSNTDKYHGEKVVRNRTNFQDSLDTNDKTLQIKVKYFTDIDKLEKISVGDWIDLRAAEDVEMKADEFKLISLGVAMKLPDGYEAHVAPRSSTFKKFGVIQTNCCGMK